MRGDLRHCTQCGEPAAYFDSAQVDQIYCDNHALLEDLDPDEYKNQHTLMGAYVSRKAAFPEAVDIEELFARVDPTPIGERRAGSRLWANVLAAPELAKADLAPRPAVLEWLADNSIYGKSIPLDLNHYVTIRRNGEVGVITLKFQQILGQHLLAMVPWKTVEKFFGAKPQ